MRKVITSAVLAVIFLISSGTVVATTASSDQLDYQKYYGEKNEVFITYANEDPGDPGIG
ncbi:hypothetical protein [Halobacillus sp. BBL2006]|uniref:hypothetical protein n=1 Tax=Halobacillus sp. BBL2006 TaxID=1543706 RepID=UPI000A7D16FA|nr:hypothetical protein [Halobacillus sp. BBL2006]